MSKNNDLVYWLRLSRTEGIGPVTFFGLLAKFGDAKTALEAVPRFNTKSGTQKYKIPPLETIKAEIDATHKFGGKILRVIDDEYPNNLAQIAPPPPVISVIGNLSLLQKPMVGVVGARNASAIGIRIARELSAGLGAMGYVVVSGLARGIDGAAHKAALNIGTIAVLAGGIDHIYPAEHAELYHNIKEIGLVVSENAFNAEVTARDFPRRNRIISGLCSGVIITEAEEKSGSLITARFALEQNREVMAVPGSPLDPRAAGPNGLIKQGAQLVTNAADVHACLQGFGKVSEPDGKRDYGNSTPIEANASTIKQIEILLSPTPISIDELCEITSLQWRSIAAIIVELELEGRAIMTSGNKVSSVR
ncbi:MAG: DNA-processing protein DprA [Pseudomonadota bacterium]